ncbi:carbamoyltransferase HypF [Pectinatus haikarae]|uniref:Carbamoyltransferase n=1 Tax=Pectinatus haikarae TaxID=349096 RepID=A0ABT9Y3I3_9FIRM|nr:carbamoyltransferase HypF [Pectinatus haikarae]MDQ0202384.1 hydrogenase maturation protein HypF [Pectinatus haikarae]
MKRLSVRVRGIVQGVGFRPFVYRLARENNLTGFVLNDDDGVLMEIQGIETSLDVMLKELSYEAPPAASVMEIVTAEKEIIASEKDFTIKKSPLAALRKAFISPDLAICADCRKEIMDKSDRRYHYPFTNCTNCGPRFSIVEDIPYDRRNTTMKTFSMCSKCREEYAQPQDRRFHAQPNACNSCGPQYKLLNNKGTVISIDNEIILESARKAIKKGEIIALKGIGGYHLVCDAYNNSAILKLRNRKKRFDKALAVMADSVDTIKTLCIVNAKEESLLKSPSAPIVLLAKKENCALAAAVAPGNCSIGFMLPYAPIHCLLLQKGDVFVMTSANLSEEPIAYEEEDALERLAGIADHFLIHDRRINMSIDDSVMQVVKNEAYYIRRSRGFAPAPLFLSSCNKQLSVFAAGSQLKNTFCLTDGNKAILSHHIGDLANKAAYDSYRKAINHYQKIFSIQPQIAACDLHPEYFSTKYALATGLPLIKIQHHHAHIVSVLAENNISEKVIGVALDGTGYGDDGCLWGGEFFLCDCTSYERLAHFSYLPLPGASAAIKEPWRLAAYIMHSLYGKKMLEKECGLWKSVPENWSLAVQIAEKGFNSPLTSSAGRIFDAVSAVLGIRGRINYEGQAAIELEQIAAAGNGSLLPYESKEKNGMCQIDFLPMFRSLIEDDAAISEKAASFHLTMAAAVVDTVRILKKKTGVRKIVLSGGVFQNLLLLKNIFALLEDDFSVYINRKVPANDGGLSFGQAAAACAIINKNRGLL